MKKYIQPKIKSIELDPKQALLQICRIGGIYLFALENYGAVARDCNSVAGSDTPCGITPKGGAGGSTPMLSATPLREDVAPAS
ncbi:MAG: hypothetical protein PHQ52_03435 [Candidatus Omnitrophica bacterium]|nr:hypothetical protein [Candidatus Omnitrophota bacterium]